MKVLDNILFRCWQMGWLDRYDPQKKQPITEDKIKAWLDMWEGYIDADMIARMKYRVIDIRNVQFSQAATDINVGHKAAGHGSNVPMQPNIPPMPSNTSNALEALNSVNATQSNALDCISRAKAIEALENDMASLDHILKGMSANDVRLDAYVSQRNQVNYDIYTINNLPPVQPEQLGTNLAEVGTDCISREQAIDICDHAIDLLKGQFGAGALVAIKESIEELPPAQAEHIIHCKDCKYFKQVFAPNDNDGLCGHWHSKYDARTSREGYCSYAERKQNE